MFLIMPKRKSTTDLLKILSDYSPQVMSNGQIRMECPFRELHKDGSGRMSFFVTPDINAYHCFSCGSHGNLVRLLTTRFKVNYFEAVSMVRLTEYKPEKKDFELDVIWSIKDLPKEFLKRGYTKKCLEHFKVGTSDDGSILIPYYSDFDYPVSLLGYQKRWYSPTRRVINGKGFDKKSYLYNLNHKEDYTILVEGQSDVWRLYQHGYNACALMGVTLSKWQINELSKFKTVYLALDNDEAGRIGIEKCYTQLKNYVDIRLVPYDAKDPGETNKKEWDDAMKNSTDYVTYSIEMSLGWDGYLDMRDFALKELKKEES